LDCSGISQPGRTGFRPRRRSLAGSSAPLPHPSTVSSPRPSPAPGMPSRQARYWCSSTTATSRSSACVSSPSASGR